MDGRPPDGGWGWVVVFASFMIHAIADGVTYTFGIFYSEFLQHFRESKGSTAWVASIMVGTTYCVGPVASGLTNRYGCRAVTVAGALLAALGLLLGTLAPDVLRLYFSVGLCTGAGFGLMYLPSIVSVTCYFERRRAFATGVAVCGSGMGTFALAPLTERLVDAYGWQGAMLLVAGLVLHCAVFGALLRPLGQGPPPPPVVVASSSSGYGTDPSTPPGGSANGRCRDVGGPRGVSGCPGGAAPPPPPGDSLALPGDFARRKVEDGPLSSFVCSSASLAQTNKELESCCRAHPAGLMYRKDIFYSGSLVSVAQYRSNPNVSYCAVETRAAKRKSRWLCCPQEMRDALREMTDVSLLRDPVFLLFGASNFLTSLGFNVPYVYTKDRAAELAIASREQASLLLAVIGASNTLGRVALGYLSDRACAARRLRLYSGSLLLCGLATALSCYASTYALMAAYCATFGATSGAYVSLTSVVLVDLLGLDKLTNAFGLLLVFEGVSCLLGPPITGWLHDSLGSYDPGFYVSGCMIAASGLLLFLVPRARARRDAAASCPAPGPPP